MKTAEDALNSKIKELQEEITRLKQANEAKTSDKRVVCEHLKTDKCRIMDAEGCIGCQDYKPFRKR